MYNSDEVLNKIRKAARSSIPFCCHIPDISEYILTKAEKDSLSPKVCLSIR